MGGNGAAVEFDATTSRTWLLSSLSAFLLDTFVYAMVGMLLKTILQYLNLVSAGVKVQNLRGVAAMLMWVLQYSPTE